jgi:uncharacterized protein
MTLKIHFPTKFWKLFLALDPLSKIIFLSLGVISISFVGTVAWNLSNRLLAPKITLAAGNETGESYIISKAIQKIVESNSNIKIDVKPTDGTTANLNMLYEGKAELVTAQADVAAGEMDISSPKKSQLEMAQINEQARSIAILYEDLFQLVVKDNKISEFAQLKNKTIALPAKGGQYKSFLKVAAHYGLSAKDFNITGLDANGKPKDNYTDEDADRVFRENQADAVFRVRAPGHKSIAENIQQYQGILVSIAQAEAMKIKYPAFEKATIPQGAYRGNPPMPAKDLPTVGVARLLMASEKADKYTIKEITRIIFEHRQEIANAIADEHAEVRPLIANIKDPRSSGGAGISIHPGALAFYEQDKPSFIQEHADYVGLILTVILLAGSWLRQLKTWIERGKKDEADEYLESAIKLMHSAQGNLEDRQNKLGRTFEKAAEAMVNEKISQESFRTFNEAYKTTREALERERERSQEAIEQKQRELSVKYINAVFRLLQDNSHSKDILQQELDRILKQVSRDLLAENLSQESFRTFIEAYKTTRDAIDRRI